jgi:hypothetical protein
LPVFAIPATSSAVASCQNASIFVILKPFRFTNWINWNAQGHVAPRAPKTLNILQAFDSIQVPLPSTWGSFGVNIEDRNSIVTKLRKTDTLRAFVDLGLCELIRAYRALPSHVSPRLFHKLRATCALGKSKRNN